MFLTHYALFQFPDWWYATFVLIHISKGFWPSVSFSSISLLEDNDNDQLHSTIQRPQEQIQTFFWNFSLLKFLLHSRKDKAWFISSFNIGWPKCPLGYMIVDHIAVTTTRKVNFLLFARPADDDCPASGKLQVLYPGLIWGSAYLC